MFPAGLVQNSDKPKTEWKLNTHQTKQSLLEAIAHLQQRDGRSFIGDLTARCLIHTSFTLWGTEAETLIRSKYIYFLYLGLSAVEREAVSDPCFVQKRILKYL